jgi:CelD/BcsL family acetyltransferase involved in cellulose biosynthesis
VSRLKLVRLESIDAIRRAAGGWDRLWLASDVSMPTVRAEMVAGWIEHFAPQGPVVALVVEEAGEPVAALPLAARRLANVVPVGDLTSNCWAASGDLLIRPDGDVDAALDLLAEGLDELPWPLVWLDLVPVAAARWQKLVESLARRGLAVDVHQRYAIGLTDIAGHYEDYFATRSRNHRQGLRKNRRRLERDGPVAFRVLAEFSDAEIEVPLRRAFEIEHKSWKGEGGTTVLDTPGAFEFFLGQARQLAAWGYLRLVFLEHRGEPIAFEFGWTAKGVYHCFKVGYDPAAAQFSPSQLLRMLLIERLHETGDCRQIDFQGPLTDAVARWSTGSYAVGRLVIAPRRTTSRGLLAAYRAAAGAKRRFLGR